MLNDFLNLYPLECKKLRNIVINNKISHAYLFDIGENNCNIDIIYAFIKEIFCRNIKNIDEINLICKKIDNGNYVDFKVINPMNNNIKKDQLIDVKNEFSKSSFEKGKKIYLIKYADRMSKQASNSILKFLEEPYEDVIAILVTNNMNLILPTILSRCQIFKFSNKIKKVNYIENLINLGKQLEIKNISIDNVKCYLDIIMKFLNFLEENKIDMLLYEKKYWLDVFSDRNYYIYAVEIILYVYYDVLKLKLKSENLFFLNKIDLSIVNKQNSINNIIEKIKIIINFRNSLSAKLNLNLSLDKFIIEMSGV